MYQKKVVNDFKPEDYVEVINKSRAGIEYVSLIRKK